MKEEKTKCYSCGETDQIELCRSCWARLCDWYQVKEKEVEILEKVCSKLANEFVDTKRLTLASFDLYRHLKDHLPTAEELIEEYKLEMEPASQNKDLFD